MAQTYDLPFEEPTPFVELVQADIRSFIDSADAAIAKLVADHSGPPLYDLAHQEIPAEGTE